MFAVVAYNAWDVSFIILSVQNFHCSFGSISRAFWLLGEARVVLERLVDARFELQFIDVPHGQKDFIYGDHFFFKIQHRSYIMQGLFAFDKVVQWRRSSSGILDNIRLQMNPFAGRVVHEGDLDVTHLGGFEGAIGSTP